MVHPAETAYLTLSRPGFLCSCGQAGTLCPPPPFENYVSLVLTAYYYIFLKACPKLHHVTHFGFHDNSFRCFLRWLKTLFLQKPLTKVTAQMALFLVFNESATDKMALCTYLKPTLNGNIVGLAKIRVLREYSIAHGYSQSRQSWCCSNN